MAPLRCTSTGRTSPSDQCFLHLGGIVRNVIDLVQPEIRRVFVENLGKDLPDSVEDDLPIGEGHVDGAFHGGEVVLAFG